MNASSFTNDEPSSLLRFDYFIPEHPVDFLFLFTTFLALNDFRTSNNNLQFRGIANEKKVS